jgi:hypothetical protein
MYKSAIFAFALLATPAMAQDAGLNFDPAQLCAWQSANNGMDTNECVKLEEDAKISLAELETSADAPRCARLKPKTFRVTQALRVTLSLRHACATELAASNHWRCITATKNPSTLC